MARRGWEAQGIGVSLSEISQWEPPLKSTIQARIGWWERSGRQYLSMYQAESNHKESDLMNMGTNPLLYQCNGSILNIFKKKVILLLYAMWSSLSCMNHSISS
ncbi:hypothetical protein NPIL_70241 [Nephila pilipes]|uniref:Uncharacterized protein n=1 Tax=Nephila pilipes TaxID=299642 RepID=A0A8X6MR04_NEPPI|nr:hypothetical protein NPIL_70241 [Nephila pilipes]